MTAEATAAGEDESALGDRGPAESVDGFLGGRVTLIQPKTGHRVGLDAALLQALVPGDGHGKALDFGSGVGAVAFAIAARAPGLSVTGIEREASLVDAGTRALALPANATFADRVKLVCADVVELPASGDADWVLMNPPYTAPGTASPNALRRDAHVAPPGALAQWIAAAERQLRKGGRIGIVHRTEALGETLAALAPRFGAATIRPVHPTPSAAAKRILVTARKGSRAPLAILPALVLHAPGGGWTPQADAILRGAAELTDGAAD